MDNKYRKSIVTFIDILGFREIVSNKPPDEIAGILSILAKASEGDDQKGIGTPGFSRAITFSDSVVRVCPIDTDENCGALFHELISMVHIQTELTNLGVFLRGGMTIGDIYFNENTIFGPAIVRAYDLESKFSNYPRIIVDDNVFEEYCRNPSMRGEAHDFEHDVNYVVKIIRESEDGFYFIDYLKAMRTELDYPENYQNILSDHKEHIIKSVASIRKISTTKPKFSWLRTYHNNVVNECINENDREKLFIADDDLRFNDS